MTQSYQSDLMMDVGLAQEIKLAARRAGATTADLKRLAEGDMFSRILPVILGFSSSAPLVKFKRWKTVSIKQGHSTGGRLIQELGAAGVEFTPFAEGYVLSRNFAAINQDNYFDVFVQSAEDLGFRSPMTRYDIVKRLQVLSFLPCTDEIPLHLLLQEAPSIGKCSSWPIDSMNVAMIPWIDNLKAHISLSINKTSGGVKLSVLYAESDYKYPVESIWMFVRKKGPLQK